MIGKKEAKKIVSNALKHTRADQIEVVIFNYDQALTRFANNYIHQNVSESNSNVSVKVVFGRKIGFSSTNSLDPQRIKETINWAELEQEVPTQIFKDTKNRERTKQLKEIVEDILKAGDNE